MAIPTLGIANPPVGVDRPDRRARQIFCDSAGPGAQKEGSRGPRADAAEVLRQDDVRSERRQRPIVQRLQVLAGRQRIPDAAIDLLRAHPLVALISQAPATGTENFLTCR